jgi:hypothetical protein
MEEKTGRIELDESSIVGVQKDMQKMRIPLPVQDVLEQEGKILYGGKTEYQRGERMKKKKEKGKITRDPIVSIEE